ncbi:MAG: hypothetical protein ABI891_04210 [Acidobacteriota bacterium]
MDTEKLKKIEKIYHDALIISPDELESFFAKHCGEDKDLRREVESLLSYRKTSDNFLDTPPESLAAEMFAEQGKKTDMIGKQIRHYKIIELLGKGGMGEVYLAEDTKLRRKIAPKLLSPEFYADNERKKRFEKEAQAISALNHPNIITISRSKIWNDEIVEEVRRIRNENAEKFNFDIFAICADTRTKQAESKRKVVSSIKTERETSDILKAA